MNIAIQPQLLDHLNTVYPNTLPVSPLSEVDMAILVGQRQVISYLIQIKQELEEGSFEYQIPGSNW